MYLGSMIPARRQWLNENRAFRPSAKTPPILIYLTYVSFERKLAEPFDKTNVTVGDSVSLNSIARPQ